MNSKSGEGRRPFRKVLIANRGEIALRVIRALNDLGIPSVAVFSDADRAARHVRMAHEAVCIGPAPSAESYLNIGRIVEAAKATGAEAVHPGYGFLSENARFASALEEAGITFIGPSPEAIDAMGEKTEARRRMAAAGVPVVPGTLEPLASGEEARKAAADAGYPVMLKASAGGGGKGMRLVHREEDIGDALRDASSEAVRAFGNGAVYLEKAVVNPRHIEIQILADSAGSTIYLGERECSLQRRHQKVVEEAPSPAVGPELRRAMGEAAVRAARAVSYRNAGTIEFLLDGEGRFYFMEMNTRLQVEHAVTEMVTGLDLVKEQIRIAAGLPLSVTQDQVEVRGWAMECRIYAEDPLNHFLPSPGRVEVVRLPEGPRVRVDASVFNGSEVSLHYDPMVAKLVTWGMDRAEAAAAMRRALQEFLIAGIRTNKDFLERIVAHPEFLAGNLDTGFIPRFFGGDEMQPPAPSPIADIVAAIAAHEGSRQDALPCAGTRPISPWRSALRGSWGSP